MHEGEDMFYVSKVLEELGSPVEAGSATDAARQSAVSLGAVAGESIWVRSEVVLDPSAPAGYARARVTEVAVEPDWVPAPPVAKKAPATEAPAAAPPAPAASEASAEPATAPRKKQAPPQKKEAPQGSTDQG